MKKKKILTEVFILFFVAAVFMAAYVVIEMGNDWLAVLGAAVVLLIAAYLLVDSWLDGKHGESEGRQSDRIIRRLDELEDVQKALYTVMKRSNTENTELLQKLNSGLVQMTEALERLQDAGLSENAESYELKQEVLKTSHSVLEAVKGMRQDYQIGVKNLIKYEKENAKQIAEAARTNTEMTIMELNSQLDKILGNLQEQKDQLSFIRLSAMSTPFSVSEEDVGHIDLDRQIEEEDLLPVLEDALMPAQISIPEVTEDEAVMPDIDAEEEEKEEFDAEAAIKAYMQEKGYVDEDEPEEPIAPEQKSPEEITNTLQSMVGDDPNRALTPEEIAAMFAAVQ